MSSKVIILLAILPTILGSPIVHTPLGTVEGVYESSYLNRTFSSFYSIPYAQPPVGNLRFAPPVPVDSWKTVFKADRVDIECPQYLDFYKGQEDCLVLNVFVPLTNINGTEKMPVIVDIHSGSFMFGYGNSYTGPEYIMDRDVIFVSINYRLGALGFMSTEDNVVPGNMGLKDQVLALKWIQKNIKAFGGDPTKISITGFSSGAASVTYHYLSPMSKNLFKNGIAMSGSPLNPWALQSKPLERAQQLGEHFGCSTTKSKKLVECLRSIPAQDIVLYIQNNEYIWLDQPLSPYGPVVEKNCKGAFLCKHPYDILAQGEMSKKPIIYSCTADEGLYPAAKYLNRPEYLPHLESNWDLLCPVIFYFHYTLSDSEKQEACNKIKKFYLNDEPVSLSTFQPLQKALTDRLFVTGIENNAKLHANFSQNVYMYRYNYTAIQQFSFARFFSNRRKQGVCQGDDVMMLFSQFHRGFPRLEMNHADRKLQTILWDMFLSFAKTGVPESNLMETTWTPLSSNNLLNYLHIDGPDNIRMENGESTIAHADFWESIPFKENQFHSE